MWAMSLSSLVTWTAFLASLEPRRWMAWWMLVGVSLGQYPPEPLVASGQCSDLTLLMVEILQQIHDAICLAEWPAVRREVIWALDAGGEASIVVEVGLRGLLPLFAPC